MGWGWKPPDHRTMALHLWCSHKKSFLWSLTNFKNQKGWFILHWKRYGKSPLNSTDIFELFLIFGRTSFQQRMTFWLKAGNKSYLIIWLAWNNVEEWMFFISQRSVFDSPRSFHPSHKDFLSFLTCSVFHSLCFSQFVTWLLRAGHFLTNKLVGIFPTSPSRFPTSKSEFPHQ